MALKRHKHHIGSRYIEVYRASGEDFLAVAGGASNEAQTFLSKGAQVIIRMRGLPYDCTAAQVLDFFSGGDNSCKVLDDSEGILFVKKPDGRSTGDAFVLFSEESEAPKALSKHRESIGQRYIELFRSTIAEVQQVLNRSMDPKTYEQNAQKPPLIAQIPPAISQMPMLPQHVITSGTEKNCIRLRGLPYEAKVEHILHFLEDFAKNIVYQGVHLVYNSQGQFNGEAFIQMDSEQAAQASAQQKHHKHMLFGKKQRYIEVFQCSGEDMNVVLNGGGYQYPSPPAISAKPLTSPGASLIAPQHVNFPPPLSHYGTSTPSPAMFSSPPQFVYWGYSGPLSPTSAYIGPLQLPPHGFAHSPIDRSTMLTVGDATQMDDGGGMKTPEVHRITSPHIEYPPNSALNVSPKINFHNDEVFYYQSQDIAHNFLTEKVLLVKNSPVAPQLCGYAAKQQQQHIVDLNNNQQISSVIELSLPSPVHCQDRMLPPLINPHFQSPQHVGQMNWSL